MAEANKAEKLGFVRLYNATVPIANVFVQDPNKLPRLGEIEHNTHMMFVAHYCWEAGLLLVASHVVDAPMGWLEDDDLRPRMTSYHCGTETSAVDSIVRMKREEWSKRCADVELAVYQHKPLRVTRYDADGVIQEDPKPAPPPLGRPLVEQDGDSASYAPDDIDETTPEERSAEDDSLADIEAELAQLPGKRMGTLKQEARLVQKLRAPANGRKAKGAGAIEQPDGIVFHGNGTDMVTLQYHDRKFNMTKAEFEALPKKAQRIKSGGR